MCIMKLSEKLPILFSLRQLRAADVAVKAGVKPDLISKWQAPKYKRRPTVDQMLRLARALDVPMEFLADEQMEKVPDRPEQSKDMDLILGLIKKLGTDRALQRLMATEPSMPVYQDDEPFEPPDIPNPHSAPKNGGSRKRRSG